MKYISVGQILNFHGIQGEAKIGFSKNQEDFLTKLDVVYIEKNKKYFPLTISSLRFNKKFAIIKFKEINSINELMAYKGMLIFTQEDTIRENLEENDFLIDELTGLDVFDENDEKVGVVVGVCNNGINDFISVKSKTKKISLVPFIDE